MIAIGEALKPHEIDLGTQNHRSPDSEILAFGNDILTAKPTRRALQGRIRPCLPPREATAELESSAAPSPRGALLKSIRAQSDKKVETIAILVTNNRSALKMSNALNALGANVGKPVRHKLLFDEAEALLSARFAAFLLEPKGLRQTGGRCRHQHGNDRRREALRRGRSRKEVAKLLEQANKIKGGKALGYQHRQRPARPDLQAWQSTISAAIPPRTGSPSNMSCGRPIKTNSRGSLRS